MKATFTPQYGPPAILETREVPVPTIADNEVLVEVHASPVTEGDRRLRAADFPSFSAILGRLLIGIRRPRNPVQGSMFAGRIVEVGAAVRDYSVGDAVFGSTDHGAYAEYLAVAEDGPMVRIPAGSSKDEAAAVPYGAVTALHFLRDLGAVKPGEKVLIVGGSGGVGVFAVQLAKHMGAEVSAVCSPENFELVRGLGADEVIDYRSEDFTQNGRRYDLIFDIADASNFRACRSSLTAQGRYLTLYLSIDALFQMAWTGLRDGPKAKFAVAMGTRKDMADVAALLEAGALRPVVGPRFPHGQIAQAHAAAERGGPAGTVLVTMAEATALRAVA